MLGPIVEYGPIKIRSGGPNQRVNFRVKFDLSEHLRIPQRAKEFALQYRLKIDVAG